MLKNMRKETLRIVKVKKIEFDKNRNLAVL